MSIGDIDNKNLPNFFFFRPKYYVPKTPYQTPSYYPQSPTPMLDNPASFEKFDIDTLFFIFYYQQGTYQQ